MFTDNDWAGFKKTRRSTTGDVYVLADVLLRIGYKHKPQLHSIAQKRNSTE